MRGGHNRKSGTLHKLQGTARADRHAKATPKPEPVAPRCPRWLDREAKKEWGRLAPRLEKLGLLTALDMVMFAMVCSTFSLWRRLDEQIEREGPVIEGHRGIKRKHPLVGARTQTAALLLTLSREFGLTPLSRQRLVLPEIDDEDDDPEGFFAWKKRNLNNGNGSR